ncbi:MULTISPECIES: ABC transporter permease [Clostridium]|uniref:ABC transporter permease n=1 Tax=Clostridium TaxID=1485 RepID=UPI000824E329|nr:MULTISPECIES: FtsX-like permease family protein [Clostridium]
MKPLSAFNYNRNNKMKFLSSIVSVAVAVGFLYMVITFVKSTDNSIYRAILNFKDYSICIPYSKSKGIPKNILYKIQSDKNVDKIIPMQKYDIRYVIPYEDSSTKILAMRNDDMNYFIVKAHDNIMSGRLPKDGKNEIAVHYDEAKNQKIKVGDIVGKKTKLLNDIDGDYKVVGIIGGENLISLMSANEDSMPNYENNEKSNTDGFIIVPKSGHINEMNKFIEKISGKQVEVYTLNNLKDQFDKAENNLGMFNIFIIASIFLMVVTVGSSRCIQFLNRKEELGILNAIGYSKRKILKRSLIEVLETNALSYILGLIFGIGMSLLWKKYVFEASGAVGIVFNLEAFVIALYIPLFTALFTIVPINVMISRLDPINMIEEN